MSVAKYVLKSVLSPIRKAGGRFFFASSHMPRYPLFLKAAHLTTTELIEGDYLEFGAFRGDSIIEAYHVFRKITDAWSVDKTHPPTFNNAVRQKWHRMRFFAFDSFQGLPELIGLDRRTNDFNPGQYACSIDVFLKNLKTARVDISKVIAVPGWFKDTCVEETIHKYKMISASVIFIDCDLGNSAATVLAFIEPLLVDGTILIFDDWYAYRGNPNLGVQRAFTEWVKTMPDWCFSEYQKEGPWQNSFIANRVKSSV